MHFRHVSRYAKGYDIRTRKKSPSALFRPVSAMLHSSHTKNHSNSNPTGTMIHSEARRWRCYQSEAVVRPNVYRTFRIPLRSAVCCHRARMKEMYVFGPIQKEFEPKSPVRRCRRKSISEVLQRKQNLCR